VRVAVIDIGSNTIHLLIAETDGERLIPIADPSRALFLGQDVARLGRISSVRLGKAVTTVADFADRARRAGAERLIALATEAIRAASNGDEVLHALQATGIRVERITSRREGELAAIGAALDSPTRAPALLADIGGASTQIVWLSGGQPRALESVPLGSGTLAAAIHGDPPGPVAVAALGGQIAPELQAALANFGPLPPINRLIGVGGTIRRLGRLAAKVPPPVEASRTALVNVVESLFRGPSDVVSRRLGLDARRVGTLRVGGLILLALLHQLGNPRLRVSAAGIREGAALLLGRGIDPATDDEVVPGGATVSAA
jgi:exopolyphosphatase/guanosine-5'-triphosphate,3'-diphosphate pyrophosphatase